MLAKMFKNKQKSFENFFGLNINLDKSQEYFELINELNCKNLMIRIPLSDIANLKEYKTFVESFRNKNITLNIIQDREHIEDKELLEKDIRLIFSAFKGICTQFQIGNAINEPKWGFFNTKEYLEFYSIVQKIRDEKFQAYKLIGPAVKGFEFQYSVRSLFNYFRIKFDKVSALLYVDKQYYPEKPRMISFDFIKQINTLYSLATLSKKASNEVIISEVNWKLTDDSTPKDKYSVDEELYASYMVRYYLLALSTKKIQTVFWFQLISTKFGLSFIKDGKIQKRKAFFAFKNMIKILNNCTVVKYTTSGGLHVLTCVDTNNKMLDALWVEDDNGSVEVADFTRVFDIYGEKLTNDIKITNSPIYAYHKEILK